MFSLRPRNTYNLSSWSFLRVNPPKFQAGLQSPFPSRQCVPFWNQTIKYTRKHSVILASCNLNLQCSPSILNQMLVRPLSASYSTSVTNSQSVQLFNNGRELLINFGDRTQSSEDVLFHATWLRYNCQCSACVFSSGQKMIAPTDLVPSLIIETAEISGESGYCNQRTFSCIL